MKLHDNRETNEAEKIFPNTYPIVRLLRYRYMKGNPEMNIYKKKERIVVKY